ncbi:putative phage-related protein [Sphingobium sp. SYK-6]|uniref:head-tail connector protein n=1 Tax=Sphingobium sp. (strain NBRC 103272 / SYK-6) TaxID=627192 RepID=UPI0002276FC1|nr:phage head-tail connector protein [Sphingobium sp. SYK-6]BAK67994.1 putative phage-related protein [Sphingobium sp. SYK-6]
MTVTISTGGPLAVPLDDLKAYLQISLPDEDAALTGLIRAASETAERFIGQLLIVRPVDEIVPAVSAWRSLAIRPVQAITAVSGIPAEGAEFALPVENYTLDIGADGTGRVRVANPGAAGRIRVTYVAGLASEAAALPDAIRHAIVRLAGERHARREGLETDLPASVSALLRPWRRMVLA